MSALDVLTLADEGFALPLAVLGRSLLEHLAPDHRIRLTVLDGGITPASRRRIERSWDDRLEARFVAPRMGALAALSSDGRIPMLTFARLLVGSILPDAARALVLDADQLVLADVAPLFQEPFAGALALAPTDAFIPTLGSPLGLSDPRAFGLAPDQPFLSGAVVMLDLDAWRREGCEAQAVRIALDHAPSLRTYDQDVLNVVLAGRWRALDARWQVQPRLATLHGEATPESAWIVHFSGRLKPWLYRGRSSWDDRYRATLSRTEFRDRLPGTSFTGLFFSLYDGRLRRLLYPIERRLERWRRRVSATGGARDVAGGG